MIMMIKICLVQQAKFQLMCGHTPSTEVNLSLTFVKGTYQAHNKRHNYGHIGC